MKLHNPFGFKPDATLMIAVTILAFTLLGLLVFIASTKPMLFGLVVGSFAVIRFIYAILKGK